MYLNAYYIHQYDYTMPTRHMQDDCKWMKENGFSALSIVVNEWDLWNKAFLPRDIDRLFNVAKKESLDVHLVPSRWANLVAGFCNYKSAFPEQHPEICLQIDNKPNWMPPYPSINHPLTLEYYKKSIDKVFSLWPFDGVIWDEPKLFNLKDTTEAANAIRPSGAGIEWDNQRFAKFFDDVGAHIRSVNADVRISMFIYAHLDPKFVDLCSQIENLDDIGIDGVPYPKQRVGKTLVEKAKVVRDIARKHGKGSFILVENFDSTKEQDQQMDQYLPEILGYDIDHVLFYYYGMRCEDPDGNMAIVAKHLKAFKKSVSLIR